MKENGWDLGNIEEEDRLVLRGKRCDLKLLDGSMGSNLLVQAFSTSMISTTFWSKGRAKLKFGNCNDQGEVSVLIDGTEIGKSTTFAEKTTISFNFDEGSNLTITAGGRSIIKLFSLKIECGKRNKNDKTGIEYLKIKQYIA